MELKLDGSISSAIFNLMRRRKGETCQMGPEDSILSLIIAFLVVLVRVWIVVCYNFSVVVVCLNFPSTPSFRLILIKIR